MSFTNHSEIDASRQLSSSAAASSNSTIVKKYADEFSL